MAGWEGCSSPPRFLLKLTFYKLTMIDNDGEKKKGAKKEKPYQIPRKLLLTLLLSCNVIPVMHKANFD